jgi:hypothetical protein
MLFALGVPQLDCNRTISYVKVRTRKSLSAPGALFCYVNRLAPISQLTRTAQLKQQLNSSWKTKYKVARVVSANICAKYPTLVLGC